MKLLDTIMRKLGYVPERAVLQAERRALMERAAFHELHQKHRDLTRSYRKEIQRRVQPLSSLLLSKATVSDSTDFARMFKVYTIQVPAMEFRTTVNREAFFGKSGSELRHMVMGEWLRRLEYELPRMMDEIL